MKFNFSKFSVLSPDKKQLLGNILYLTVVQGTNYLLPLITLPYLVRVLGPEKYGLLAFAQAFNQYFSTITDYGFIHTAPRRVSIYRDDKDRLQQIFNAIIMAKFILLILCFFILTGFVVLFSKFRSDWGLYLISFLVVLGNVMFPVWFFQGIEKMKYITALNIIAKAIFTLAIFIFIKSDSDYIFVPLLNSVGLIVSGVASYFIIVHKLKIMFCLPLKHQVYEELKEGWHVFTGMFSVNLFSSSNVVILGLFSNNVIVGYFKAGDTLIRAVCGLLQPVNNAVYPYVSRLAITSKVQAITFLRKLLLIVGIFTFIFSISILFSSVHIVHLVFGDTFFETIRVVKILAFLPFVIGLSNILAVQGLLAFNYNKLFTKIVTASALLNIALALLLTPFYKHIGISFSLIVTEVFTTGVAFWVVHKHINLFNNYT